MTINNCEKCGSDNIYYYATMLLKVYGTINKDGSVDEASDHAIKPIKNKVTGYSCLDCDHEISH